MAISIGERDEDIERIPRQWKKIVWFRTFTADSRHRTSLPVRAIAINGIVAATTVATVATTRLWAATQDGSHQRSHP
jgi:hypothetical protein